MRQTQFQELADQFGRFLIKTADKLYDRRRTDLADLCSIRHNLIKHV